MKCKFCGSTNVNVQNCRCGYPCILYCLDCKKTDHESLPHRSE